MFTGYWQSFIRRHGNASTTSTDTNHPKNMFWNGGGRWLHVARSEKLSNRRRMRTLVLGTEWAPRMRRTGDQQSTRWPCGAVKLKIYQYRASTHSTFTRVEQMARTAEWPLTRAFHFNCWRFHLMCSCFCKAEYKWNRCIDAKRKEGSVRFVQ